MPGEVWRSVIRAGKETTPGTAVVPTRKMYWDAFSLTPTRDSRPVRVATGTRDNVRGHTQGPFAVGGSLTTRISPAEVDELLELAIDGTPAVTTPSGGTLARQRVYTPDDTSSATIQMNDGAALWTASGVRANSMTLDGSVDGETNLSFDLFGSSFATLGALTGSVTDRNVFYLESWQATFSMAPFGSSTYTTYPNLVFAYNVTVGNNLGRVYTLNNTLNANRTSTGLIDITASLTFDASDAQAQQVITDWQADGRRVIRLTFLGTTADIEAGQTSMFQIELPGAWTAPDMTGETQSVRSYAQPMQYIYDSVLGAGIKITTINGRATIW